MNFLHPKKEGIEEGFEQEREKGETRAHATPLASTTTEPTFPALPPSVFENLPALNSPAVARSTALPTAPAPTPAPAPLPTSNATPAQPQPAAETAPSADTLVNQDPAPTATACTSTADAAPAPAPAPALPDATVAAINAQRAKNGKGKLTQRDIGTLSAEAAKAGIAAEAAAQWVLAKPTRNFFKADWYKPEAAPAPAAAAEEPTLDAKRAAATLASMIPAAPQTDEEKAAAAQAAVAAKARIRQILEEPEARQAAQAAAAPATAAPAAPTAPTAPAAPAAPATSTAPTAHELALSRQLAQRCADNTALRGGNLAALFTGTSSAAPITTAPAAPATGFLPEVGPKGSHARIVNRALRGEIVSSLPLKMACQVCGLNFADVKARSASARTTATA